MILLHYLTLVFLPTASAQYYQNVSHLYKSLLVNYNKHLPPRRNLSSPVHVWLKFQLLSIEEVDVIREVFVSNILVTFCWEDHHINWNSSEYANLTHLRFPRSNVWTPDIVIQNSVDHVPYLGSSEYLVTIDTNGYAFMALEIKASTLCFVKVDRFPFDTQKCTIMFASDHYTRKELQIKQLQVGGYNFAEIGPWYVVKTTNRSGVELSEMFGEDIDFYSVTLTVKRHSLLYVLNLFIPILVISTVSPFVFVVNSESGEKLSISVTLFLSFTVFASTLSSLLPQTSSSTSLLSVFVCLQLLLSGLYVICCVLIQRVSFMNKHNRVTAVLAKLVCSKPQDLCKEGEESNDTEPTKLCDFKDLSARLDRVMFAIAWILHLVHTVGTVKYITS